jgi:hypothetical protein
LGSAAGPNDVLAWTAPQMRVLELIQPVLDAGYVFVHGRSVHEAIAAIAPLTDWTPFAESWNDLEVDQYLGERGCFRRRRYAVYEATREGGLQRKPHQPHVQRREYNPLFGGVERWFAPVREDIGAGASMTAILRFCLAVFGGASPSVNPWHVEVHQFRIEAKPGAPGHPTPEGIHRDGVDFVLVLLVARSNIASGTTTVHGTDGHSLGSFTLTDPFDAAIIDDTRVAHGVTPVSPLDGALPAHRDVLVVTFRRPS